MPMMMVSVEATVSSMTIILLFSENLMPPLSRFIRFFSADVGGLCSHALFLMLLLVFAGTK